jgi:hypothetical protein
LGLRTAGIIEIVDPDLSQTMQVPTFTCPHCGCVGRVTSEMGRGQQISGQPLLDPNRHHANDDGGWCFKCAAIICRKPGCADHVEPKFHRDGFGY